jgi:hypothetical protein
MYSPSPPQLPQLLCCGCALCTSLGGPGGPLHDVHGHLVFSPVVHGTVCNETPCTYKYETHNGGLPGKASGLVRETACYGPSGTQAYAAFFENPMMQTQEAQLQQSMWQWLSGLDLVGPSVTPTFSTNLCSDPSNLGSHSTSHTA